MKEHLQEAYRLAMATAQKNTDINMQCHDITVCSYELLSGCQSSVKKFNYCGKIQDSRQTYNHSKMNSACA